MKRENWSSKASWDSLGADYKSQQGESKRKQEPRGRVEGWKQEKGVAIQGQCDCFPPQLHRSVMDNTPERDPGCISWRISENVAGNSDGQVASRAT